jgi:hypothetical protein
MYSKLEKQGNKWTFRYYEDGTQKRKTIEAFSYKEAQKLQLDFLSQKSLSNKTKRCYISNILQQISQLCKN